MMPPPDTALEPAADGALGLRLSFRLFMSQFGGGSAFGRWTTLRL